MPEEDQSRVGPAVPCVAPAGSTAEQPTGTVTDAKRTDYADTADALTLRIVALGPQILALTSPWELFRVPGFSCDDLAPSLMQASYALAAAQASVRKT